MADKIGKCLETGLERNLRTILGNPAGDLDISSDFRDSDAGDLSQSSSANVSYWGLGKEPPQRIALSAYATQSGAKPGGVSTATVNRAVKGEGFKIVIAQKETGVAEEQPKQTSGATAEQVETAQRLARMGEETIKSCLSPPI